MTNSTQRAELVKLGPEGRVGENVTYHDKLLKKTHMAAAGARAGPRAGTTAGTRARGQDIGRRLGEEGWGGI